MKKIIIFILLALIGFACEYDSGETKVKMFLDQTMRDIDGNSIFDSSSEIHVAVFNGVPITKNLIKTESFSGASTVLPIRVDPGFNRYFIYILVNSEGYATYSGSTLYETVVGPIIYIPVTLTQINIYLQQTTETIPQYLSWDFVDGAFKYELLRSTESGSDSASVYAETQLNAYFKEADGYYYSVRAYFDAFNVYSVSSNEVLFQNTLSY